jgi:TolB-like protein/DNA-binding winged helix-turn-helix (wHTH) protein/Tfp pilus assembly protein PilF
LQESRFLDFGAFRVDRAKGVLLRDGAPVALSPKAFGTLLRLLEEPGQVVTKAELMESVWPDAIVEENNLTQAVSALRKALGDANGEPQVVVTVPKRGYRFLAEVRAVSAQSGETSAAPSRRSAAPILASTGEMARPLREMAEGRGGPFPASPGVRRRRTILAAALLVAVAALAAAALAVRLRSRPISSIAILPFINASGDPNAEYLSDGLTESLINNVSQVPDLKVIARSSVFRYKGKETDPKIVARELGVRAVLTGRVVPHGDALSISVELVDAAEDRHLWGEQYDRRMSDLQSIQEEIVREVSAGLRLRLTGEEKGRLGRRATRDPEAYELYLRGRYIWNQRTREAMPKAIEQFSLARQKDPAFALAYVGIADVYALMGLHYYNFAPPRESFPLALEAVRIALQLDDGLGEAHTAMARCKMYYEWDFAGAEREFRRGLDLTPGDANARHSHSHLFIALGRFEESLAESLKALELDPVSAAINAHLGEHYRQARTFDLAISQSRKALELGPFATAELEISQSLVQEGRYPEAVAELEKAKSSYLGNTVVLGTLGEAYGFAGRRAEAKRILADLEQRRFGKEYIGAETLAQICIGLGDKDGAFRWLETALADRSSILIYLKTEPFFDPLRADPRFADLVKRVVPAL